LSPRLEEINIESGPTSATSPLLWGIPYRVGGQKMIKLEKIDAILHAYFVESLSLREIA
jgi:hypothetical protein